MLSGLLNHRPPAPAPGMISAMRVMSEEFRVHYLQIASSSGGGGATGDAAILCGHLSCLHHVCWH